MYIESRRVLPYLSLSLRSSLDVSCRVPRTVERGVRSSRKRAREGERGGEEEETGEKDEDSGRAESATRRQI